MHTEHSVRYEIISGAKHRDVKREVFTEGWRILGTETVTLHWYEGSYSGWRWRQERTETTHFSTIAEATAWIDEMFLAWELAHVGKRAPASMIPSS